MKNTVIGILVAWLGVGAWGYFVPKDLGAGTPNCLVSQFIQPGLASTTLVTTGNNMVLPTSSVRDYVYIYNAGADRVAFNFGDAAVAGKGYILNASSTLEISPCGSFYTKGSIQATMNSGGGSATLQMFIKHVAQ